MTGGPSQLYLLLLRFPAAATVRVGALGRFAFAAGDYVYVGSAARGLDARVARHLRRRKAKHWHVDHLTTARAARVVGAVLLRDAPVTECALSRAVRRVLAGGGPPPAPGLGVGDCRGGCPAHLWPARRRLALAELARFAARAAPGATVEGLAAQRPAARSIPICRNR